MLPYKASIFSIWIDNLILFDWMIYYTRFVHSEDTYFFKFYEYYESRYNELDSK